MPLRDKKRISELEDVIGQTYQLIGALSDVVPDAEKWLDNLAAGKLVHKKLLPVVLETTRVVLVRKSK